ncbi:MAG TPA: serine/threonine-protein kinase, partial [Solirubrobacter sp.]|nr:serine/threonine-protein kinase [Solirubrobacter sp.]
MVSLINRIITDYLLESQIGAGSVGTVFRARHPSGRLAAIKAVHPELTRDRGFAQRFARIAGATRLSHPYAVTVDEVGESSGQFFIRMELLTNGSLRTLLERHAELLPLPRGLDYMRQVAEVLAYAHGRGVVHRDLKPENVLCARPGAGGVIDSVAVVDWGLTQLIDTGVTVVGGRAPGSPRYMSPEQCKGGVLDHRSDIYSFGVVLYEVATGMPPFRIGTFAEAFDKHVSTPPPSPRAVAPMIPAQLEAIILRCLAKAPDQRYQSAEEVAAELRQLLGNVAPQRLRVHIKLPDAPAAPTPPPSADPARPKERRITWRGEEQPRADAPVEVRRVVEPEVRPPADARPVAATPAPPAAPTVGKITVPAAGPLGPPGGPAVAPPNAPPVASALPAGPPAAANVPADPRPRVHLKASALDLVDAGPTLPVGIGQRGDAVAKGAKQASRSKRIQIVLDRTALLLVPDQPQVLRVTLVNAGRTTEHFPLSVEGVPASWVQ